MLPSAIVGAVAGGGEISATGALRVFIGVAAVVALSLVATARPFYRVQRIPAVGAFISGGWAAIAVGLILGRHVLNVVDRDVLLDVRPLIMIALGWIGVIVGMQGRWEILRRVPPALWRWTALDALLSAILSATIAAFVMGEWLHPDHRSLDWVLPPVLMLACCMIGWAPETRSIRVAHTPKAGRLALLLQSGAGLSAMAAIVLFGITYRLTGRDELGRMDFTIAENASKALIALVVAALLGLGGRFMLQRADRSRPDALTVFIGVVAISAGVAATLRFSPLFGSMLVGVVVANLTGPRVRDFERFIMGAEHAVALLFYLLAGVLLEPAIGLWGAILVAAFVLIRIAVKPFAMQRSLAAHAAELPARSVLYAASIRQSPIAIAIAVGLILSEASTLHRRLLTVVVLVGLISELLPYLVSLRQRRSLAAAAAELPAMERP